MTAHKGVRESIIDGTQAGQRFDTTVAEVWPDVSRAVWSAAIKRGEVVLDGRPAKPAQKTLFGSKITVLIEPDRQVEPLVSAQGESPEVLYQDDDVIVINKPAGLIVHPIRLESNEPSVVGTFQSDIQDEDPLRPGVVHRLDRDTSGVMVLARTPAAKTFLQAAFRARKVKKTYWALVLGDLGKGVKRLSFGLAPASGKTGVMRVDPLGKASETLVSRLQFGGQVSLVEARPVTGRTHQIRIHLSALGFPILGDSTYGRAGALAPRQMLHARTLSLVLPSGQHKTFEASLPKDFQATMEQYSCQMPLAD